MTHALVHRVGMVERAPERTPDIRAAVDQGLLVHYAKQVRFQLFISDFNFMERCTVI